MSQTLIALANLSSIIAIIATVIAMVIPYLSAMASVIDARTNSYDDGDTDAESNSIYDEDTILVCGPDPEEDILGYLPGYVEEQHTTMRKAVRRRPFLIEVMAPEPQPAAIYRECMAAQKTVPVVDPLVLEAPLPMGLSMVDDEVNSLVVSIIDSRMEALASALTELEQVTRVSAIETLRAEGYEMVNGRLFFGNHKLPKAQGERLIERTMRSYIECDCCGYIGRMDEIESLYHGGELVSICHNGCQH